MRNAVRAIAAATAALLAAFPGLVRAEAQGGSLPLDDATLLALAVTLAVSPAPQAVEGQPASAPAPKDEPQLELVTTVRARAMVFSEVPRVSFKFSSNGPRRTVWRTERVNLPAHAQPGVVYRDVTVKLTLTTTMDDLAILLREAKSASRGLRLVPDAPAASSAAAAVPASTTAPHAASAAAPAVFRDQE
jgi:hypothetical protein